MAKAKIKTVRRQRKLPAKRTQPIKYEVGDVMTHQFGYRRIIVRSLGRGQWMTYRMSDAFGFERQSVYSTYAFKHEWVKTQRVNVYDCGDRPDRSDDQYPHFLIMHPDTNVPYFRAGCREFSTLGAAIFHWEHENSRKNTRGRRLSVWSRDRVIEAFIHAKMHGWIQKL